MRLDKLTIGSPKDSPTHQFKNLKDVTIDFDQEHWVTVVIGWNGTGKSNVLEALATIFRDLIQKKRAPAFAYKLIFRVGSGDLTTLIKIDADPDREKDAYLIRIALQKEEDKPILVQSPSLFDDPFEPKSRQRILLLDNVERFRETVREFLELHDYEVFEASSPTQALDLYDKCQPDLVITDIRSIDDTDVNDVSGLTMASQLPPSVPKIIMSAFPTFEMVRMALGANLLGDTPIAVDFISKFEGLSALLTSVQLALGKVIKFSSFVADDSKYLPRYVFSYYSGESTRMHDVYRPYLETYDSKLRNGEDPGLKRLFYALPVHSQFVLLAFLIQQNDVMRDFLEKHLGLDPDEGIESVLFVLRQPPWKSKAKDGDKRFWNARGVVKDFLARLYDIALAPIRIKRRVSTTLWNKENLEFLYLYVKDIEALRQLVGSQPPAEFFRDLESTYVSELIEEVRIRVRLKKNDGSVTFREMSEGEQQLLTVLGLLRFTAGEESLFLLDEPDTHLNPRWSVDYLNYLRDFVGAETKNQETSHIVLTTHNPLSIAELVKEQVQILQLKRDESERHIIACHPDLDPRGQGYAAIVTSDMFGIASSLDKPTQELLEKQRLYAAKKTLTADEQIELDHINQQLDRLGFRFFHPDDEYSRYLRLRSEALVKRFGKDGVDELAAEVVELSREEREELAEELISALNDEE